MSDDAKKPNGTSEREYLVFVCPDNAPTKFDLPDDSAAASQHPDSNDPWFWDGRLRTEDEMTGIVYEIMRKALRYPVMAGCDLGWGGTYGKFPYDVARLIIQEGPIDLQEFIRFDAETMSWYLWTMASTYVHFGPERAHAARERLRREMLEAIEHGIQNSVE